jgi:hypothetical protein
MKFRRMRIFRKQLFTFGAFSSQENMEETKSTLFSGNVSHEGSQCAATLTKTALYWTKPNQGNRNSSSIILSYITRFRFQSRNFRCNRRIVASKRSANIIDSHVPSHQKQERTQGKYKNKKN